MLYFLEGGGRSLNLCVEIYVSSLEFVLDLRPFLMGYFGCSYNDLVICKDSNDCQPSIM